MREKDFKRLVYIALMTALITVGTMVIQIPTPYTKGYVNIGDSFIFLSASILGPFAGFISGGVGSALADLLSGYVVWAPWTFVIKGLEGLIAALLWRRKSTKYFIRIAVFILAAIWMVFGYYIGGAVMYGFKAALADVPGNIIQGIGSVIIGSILVESLSRIKYFKDLKQG
ncbi:ECF transporter S component [Thermoanaerobacterium thermosaccharolyticum]|uniref:ECF transporter S component n=1 Tax=Thermoanaerobacterium thermosaccharolyticum TaxID=1517 RepID=UPI003D2DF78D